MSQLKIMILRATVEPRANDPDTKGAEKEGEHWEKEYVKKQQSQKGKASRRDEKCARDHGRQRDHEQGNLTAKQRSSCATSCRTRIKSVHDQLTRK